MFLTNCTTCGLRELRGTRAIDILVNTEQGPELVYHCTRCARANVLTGDRPATPALPLVAA